MTRIPCSSITRPISWRKTVSQKKPSPPLLRQKPFPRTAASPNKLEEIVILETAIRLAKTAPMAHLYLGNLLYDKKRYTEAIFHWETTVKEKDTISMAYRNLSIAYCNKEQDLAKAMTAMKNALALDPAYPPPLAGIRPAGR
ncbi:MAG: hypothetical protein ACLR2E_07125 [Lachnospiraceae bacterium]